MVRSVAVEPLIVSHTITTPSAEDDHLIQSRAPALLLSGTCDDVFLSAAVSNFIILNFQFKNNTDFRFHTENK